MHLKNGLSKRRYYSCSSYEIWQKCLFIYSPEHSRKKKHRCTSTDSKTFVVVVTPLEYIRKQQVANPKRAE